MTSFKLSLAVLAGSAALLALPAAAQTAGIATVSPDAVIFSTKAFGAANQQIGTTYKAQLDQASQQQQALDTQIRTLIDTNKDGQVSQAELQAAQAQNSAIGNQVRAAQQKAQPGIEQLQAPAVKAQAYALEQVALKYDPALQAVARAKSINIVLAPNAIVYAPPATDISAAVTAELDRTTPTVAITPPANWQPAQETIALLQQYRQAVYAEQVRRAQAAPQAGAPAAGTPAPATPAPTTGSRPKTR